MLLTAKGIIDDDRKQALFLSIIRPKAYQGFFQYSRLPFRMATGPGIYQRVMDCLLNGNPGVTLYLVDIFHYYIAE